MLLGLAGVRLLDKLPACLWERIYAYNVCLNCDTFLREDLCCVCIAEFFVAIPKFAEIATVTWEVFVLAVASDTTI